MFQLCYASQSTSTAENLLQDLRNILTEARNANTQHQVSGVLCYAEGYFFQCLQGDEQAVQEIFAGIVGDSRHQNIQIFTENHVAQQRFQDWAMKYVMRNSEIKAYFQQLGHAQFLPHQLNATQVDGLLQVLYEALNHSVVDEVA
ncbi:BLUF domain-containing protein [Acinetobacter indicus]|uniref:BLUF domain-containing protein n=1 Tax=Acinetobacter indicus TaxID=756892 RepID=UPI001266237C|nr:BLUF domain-containing protein [Acinetobacter indicus]QFS17665.1 BLUF domain-containing protein [Acinetobacter indicus]QIC79278.1 BLUF domain-containing protein [Acinetobacter indicus]